MLTFRALGKAYINFQGALHELVTLKEAAVLDNSTRLFGSRLLSGSRIWITGSIS